MNYCRKPSVSGVLAIAALCLGTSSPVLAEDCSALAGLRFGHAVVVSTDASNAPITTTSLAEGKVAGVNVRRAFCRVRGLIQPSADSNIAFEVWLPVPDQWNGRYQGIGNGGFAGSINYANMGRSLENGYAVSATDTGHVGESWESAWALGHPEKITDLAWRSIHEAALASKAVIAAFYGKAPIHSYFVGCSTGGRQGLVEAQRFPDDYDGIVAGAPAIWPQLLAFGASVYKRVEADPEAWVSPGKFALINRASLAACDGENGVLDDPGSCKFNPAQLLCKGKASDSCLTPKELATVQFLYSGLNDENGHSLYPGLSPGDEYAWSSQRVGKLNDGGRSALSYPYAVGMFGIMIRQDPTWTISRFDVQADLAMAINSTVGKALYAENPDLRAFKARGGKLIGYHGWNDPAIPAALSIRYHEAVATAMHDRENLQSFYRLFLGPGMEHCGGGPGPNAVGGASGVSASQDPEHDIVSALARWVEEDVPPSRIVATRYREGEQAKGVESQRPWCSYPAVARFDGRGNRNSASSYTCVVPKN